MSDTRLLAAVAEFNDLYRQHQKAATKARAMRDRLERRKDCPALGQPGPHATDARMAFLERHGWCAEWDKVQAISRKMGAAANALFAIPAATPAGVLAKLKIVRLAVGTGTDDGDSDLEAYQHRRRRSWFDTTISDFERIVAD